MSGWSNYSGMVTSQKMNENEMGYRGSKSEFQSPQPNEISVKEQRVDGSWCFLCTVPLFWKKKNAQGWKHLRCTLTGCESSYQVKIPSKQLNNRSFSTWCQKPGATLFGAWRENANRGLRLNPWFLTGFSDAYPKGIGMFYYKNTTKWAGGARKN